MADISIRGELWDNDSADILRWMGWRDLTAPMDIQAALEAAGGEDVTILVNSQGGDMTVGAEIRSMLRRYQGKTTALIQGYAASAATLAISACRTSQSEAGALLCYHNPSSAAEGDYRAMRRSAESLRNARDAILEMYTARSGAKSREELMALMDEIVGLEEAQDLLDDPAAFVAATGHRMRLTAAMRERYQAHVAEERAKEAREDEARRALARISALAKF